MSIDVPVDFDPIAYTNEPRWQASRLGLDRTRELLKRLGNPQESLKFVHVAGTNGKGSTCAYIASILQAAGLRVGLFTSPYIEHFEERIRVNGENISADDLLRVTLEVRRHAEAMAAEAEGEHPTEFELMTAVAFTHFACQHCDVVVCEVGLGGRLDSTNVIDAPEVAVITRIGLDHTTILGDTLGAIAAEKAGIIKSGSKVVSYPQEPEAMAVIEDVAHSAGCELTTPDFGTLSIGEVVRDTQGVPLRQFSYGTFDALQTRLLGSYQPQNAALALEVVRVLRLRGWNISEAAVQEGVASTVWPGRFEVSLAQVQNGAAKDQNGSSQQTCTVVIDGGHNPQGASVLVDSLKSVFPGQKPLFIMGVMADKNYRSMLETVLPLASALVTVQPNNPRALSAEALAEAAEEVCGQLSGGEEGQPPAETCASPIETHRLPISADQSLAASTPSIYAAADFDDAVRAVMEEAQDNKNPLICAFGSLYAIADIKEALRRAGLL